MNEGLHPDTITDESDYAQFSDAWWTTTKRMINRGSREFWARRGKTDEAETEVVHHKNGNVQDNRLENLEVMTFSEHTKLHNTLRKKVISNA